jgi:two-component system response regulator
MADILMVEDNPNDAELTIRALRKRHLANPVFIAQDGQEALDFLFHQGVHAKNETSGLPKVILLDLKLPKISGLEVLKAIKENEQTRTIPVVVLTSSREDPDVKSAYALGANSYVVKPVEFDQFMEALSSLGFYWLLLNESPK